MGMTLQEIRNNILPMFGPDATDAFIIKNNAPYYTRDGMEVLESLTFDNELARYIHHILFQAAYDQGKKIGDGTTTLVLLYTYIYKGVRERIAGPGDTVFKKGLNTIREAWNKMVDKIIGVLKSRATPLTSNLLASMLNTCTQDVNLAARLYNELKDPLMSGAYIVPTASNITDDFRVTTYNRPVFRATRQYTLKPMPTSGKVQNVVGFYCNGMLDIAHVETLLGMLYSHIAVEGESAPLDITMIIYCHGATDRTRTTLKELAEFIRTNGIDITNMNNLAIYTLDDYRKFDREEIDDVIAILTDENGASSVTQAITFETLLYRAFFRDPSLQLCFTPGEPMPLVEELETFDMDLSAVERTRNLLYQPYNIELDPEEGVAIDRILGPVALRRHAALKKEIEDEKSDIRKVNLNKRMRRTFGMFVEVEVGSTLLKDSQRKYELILDAILSAAEAARDGVLEGNALLHTIQAVLCTNEERDVNGPEQVLYNALADTFMDLVRHQGIQFQDIYDRLTSDDENNRYDITDFNLRLPDNKFWPNTTDSREFYLAIPSGNELLAISQSVTEPLGVITAILKKSVLAVELAATEVFHISGDCGYMNNFIENTEDDFE